MKIIIANPSSDNLSYISGLVAVNAYSSLEVSSDYWLRLYSDVQFLKDLRNSNITVSDGANTYRNPESENYVKYAVESVSYQQTINQPFAAKVLPTGKKLYIRVHGVSQSVSGAADNIDFLVPYNECKLTGIEIINGEDGDKVSFQVLDTPSGLISGTPYAVLNQFGTNVNVVGAFYDRSNNYDADLIKDMTLRLIYDATNSDLNPKTVYINFIIHEVKT